MKTKALALAALCTALIAVSAFVRLPIGTVAVTLQVALVLLTGLVLGGKWGAMSVAAYVALGLAGLPVFTKGGGVSYVLQYEFGYLLGFIAAAYVCGAFNGFFLKRFGKTAFWKGALLRLFAAALGIAALYAVALPYVSALSHLHFQSDMAPLAVVRVFCLAYLPLDALKAVLAALLAQALLVRGIRPQLK